MTVIAQDDHLTAGAWAACGQRDLAPRALHMLRKFLATRSEELQLNEAAKIILYGLSSYCYQSKQVIVNVN